MNHQEIINELNNEFINEYQKTRGQLESSFDKVKNPQNWKLPIDSVCEMKDIADIKEAIIFFTGSVPTFKPCAHLTGKYTVKAAGYYAAMDE